MLPGEPGARSGSLVGTRKGRAPEGRCPANLGSVRAARRNAGRSSTGPGLGERLASVRLVAECHRAARGKRRRCRRRQYAAGEQPISRLKARQKLETVAKPPARAIARRSGAGCSSASSASASRKRERSLRGRSPEMLFTRALSRRVERSEWQARARTESTDARSGASPSAVRRTGSVKAPSQPDTFQKPLSSSARSARISIASSNRWMAAVLPSRGTRSSSASASCSVRRSWLSERVSAPMTTQHGGVRTSDGLSVHRTSAARSWTCSSELGGKNGACSDSPEWASNGPTGSSLGPNRWSAQRIAPEVSSRCPRERPLECRSPSGHSVQRPRKMKRRSGTSGRATAQCPASV